MLLIMAANAVLGSTEAYRTHALWGLTLSAVVQCIIRIPPEAGCDAGVHISVHDCLAAPSAMQPQWRIVQRCKY